MSSDTDKTSVPPAAVIKVVVIEDHREFRDYLAALISRHPGLSLRRQLSLDGGSAGGN
jgi:hypothetical protein